MLQLPCYRNGSGRAGMSGGYDGTEIRELPVLPPKTGGFLTDRSLPAPGIPAIRGTSL